MRGSQTLSEEGGRLIVEVVLARRRMSSPAAGRFAAFPESLAARAGSSGHVLNTLRDVFGYTHLVVL